ncbi:MAG: globin domain-containing protein [Pseudomonadota bacterium]
MAGEIDPLDAAALNRVADSFAVAHADALTVGRLFFDTLFERYPHTREMFRGDLDEQGLKLMNTLHLVVASLGHPEVVRPLAEDLARRHLAYGVRQYHYQEVGEALIATFYRHLGPEIFDPETSDAWTRAYTMLADTMIAAAYPQPVN